MEWINSVDFTILNFLQNHIKCEFMDVLMPIITTLGNAGALWIVITVILLLTKKYRKDGAMLAAGLILGLIICNIILKPLVARPRPCWITDIALLIKNPTDYSFPSGHTLASVISACILSKANKKFALPSIIIAALIAFSRLYLYVHYPSDVIAATVIGVAIALSVIHFSKRFEKNAILSRKSDK